jgi:hypothetical protein
MKEGDQGPKRAGESKEKREAKTRHLQKNGTKKEDLKKKTLSRNRPPLISNTLIYCPNKASSSRQQPKRQR